jgi:tetratricopeptide (TPR) repeat protein
MSNGPAGPEQPDRSRDEEATGVFSFAEPPGGATTDGTEQLPGAAASKLLATEPGGTGAYEPDSGATVDPEPEPSITGLRAAELTGGTAAFEASGDASGPAVAAGPADARCGRYLLKRFHAKGGMGEIWMAEDPAIGRKVALKRMLRQGGPQQRRFLTEAQVTGQLEHPGIVPVHEAGVNEQGQPYYVMKFVRGRTLQKVIDDHHAARKKGEVGEVEEFRLLQIFLSLCQTVAYAHSRGVLHRDLKPENVMLGSYGETLLLDWGIAKVIGRPEAAPDPAEEAEQVRLLEPGQEHGTMSGAILGSPMFISPEGAAGLNDKLDQRSDVYLLGGILYSILTGRVPREGKNVLEMFKRAQREMPTAPRKLDPRIPRALEAVCLKALAMRPEDRYQSALDLAADVQRYAAGEPVTAYRESLSERAWRWAKRHRTALIRTAAALLVLGVLLAGGVWAREQVRQAEDRRRADLAEAQRVQDEAKRKQEEAEHKQEEADREAARLKELDQARAELREFRRLADEARFFAASTDPVAEQAPYFDPHEGERRAGDALALAARWGAESQGLPLPAERDALRKDRYDLLLLLVESKLRQPGAAQAADAVALLDEAVRSGVPSRSYFRLRAAVRRRLNDGAGAVEDQRRADAPNTPTTSLDHFLLGEEHRRASRRPAETDAKRKAGQPDAEQMALAIREYREALAQDPDHYWAHLQLGRCYMSLGRYAESVEALGACVALRRDVPWAYSLRGLALAQQQGWIEAERDLNEAIRLSSESGPARLTRGVVYRQQGKDGLALADFNAVLRPGQGTRLVEAAYHRGQMSLQRGKREEALADFDLVAGQAPHYRPVFRDRARLCIALAQQSSWPAAKCLELRALQDLDAYLTGRYPVETGPWELPARRGRELMDMHAELPLDKRFEPAGLALAGLAITELLQAVAQGGRTAAVFEDLGAIWERVGDLPNALKAYDAGLAADSEAVTLHVKRGWARLQLNPPDMAGSLADFRAATRLGPENGEAHAGLGYVLALRQSPVEAQREADLALLHGGDEYLTLHNVACIYARLSEADEGQADAHQQAAVAMLRRAIKLWRQHGGLSEIDQIREEEKDAFKVLSKRPDFRALLGEHRWWHPSKMTR